MEQSLIDKDNVLKGIEELKQSPFVNSHDSYVRHMMRETLDVVAKLVIEAQPTVEAEERKQERCEYCKDGKTFIGAMILFGNDALPHDINYCPNCGAKMRKGEQE